MHGPFVPLKGDGPWSAAALHDRAKKLRPLESNDFMGRFLLPYFGLTCAAVRI